MKCSYGRGRVQNIQAKKRLKWRNKTLTPKSEAEDCVSIQQLQEI